MGNVYKVQQQTFFRTPVRIKIPATCPDSLFEHFFAEFNRIDRKFNSHIPGSVTDRINRLAGKFVDIDEETATLYNHVLTWSEVTRGSFDITITPLLRLWGFYSETPVTIPTSAKLKEVSRQVNFREIELAGERIRIGKGQEITTGGFLKGYAVDCVLKKMRQQGITDAIINAGGSSIGCFTNSNHPAWKAIITHPSQATATGMIPLPGGALSTSSALSRQVIFRQSTCSHILDAASGHPVSNLQCGLITPDCLSGDILSTALLQIHPEEFFPSLKRYGNYIPVEGYLMTSNHHQLMSGYIKKNFNQYVV